MIRTMVTPMLKMWPRPTSTLGRGPVGAAPGVGKSSFGLLRPCCACQQLYRIFFIRSLSHGALITPCVLSSDLEAFLPNTAALSGVLLELGFVI